MPRRIRDATKLPIERTIFYIVSIILSVVVSIVGLLIIFIPSEYILYVWMWSVMPTWIIINLIILKGEREQ